MNHLRNLQPPLNFKTPEYKQVVMSCKNRVNNEELLSSLTSVNGTYCGLRKQIGDVHL